MHLNSPFWLCFPFSLKEHQRQRHRRRRRRTPGEPRLHPAVPAGPGQGADPVPHHLHRGHRPGHHHAGARLAGGCHRPGPGLPEGGRPQDSWAGGQDGVGGPGAGIHCAEGKPSSFTPRCREFTLISREKLSVSWWQMMRLSEKRESRHSVPWMCPPQLHTHTQNEDRVQGWNGKI